MVPLSPAPSTWTGCRGMESAGCWFRRTTPLPMVRPSEWSRPSRTSSRRASPGISERRWPGYCSSTGPHPMRSLAVPPASFCWAGWSRHPWTSCTQTSGPRRS
ncbi:hypothetical protein IscW_ISCW011924 [Ixodes scapularis]|uniref:Uncharacterized protein n=1 Tax=Ixodes scapularis TaxID=6945 RepID=B7QBI3_IXOSC|nr:hypothetical protein IscW_ISCW011924 [Ixodes scapularis]|eukprot:XP_002412909.1 hypothetical protein IscW_ISCW011924 [Ixodes scapularis]